MLVRRLSIMLAVIACGGGAPPPAVGNDLRIVSLTPSATEVVAALGSTAQLVGVDDFSPYPPEVKKLPKVGSFLTPNLETIIRLRPSFVIVDDIHGSTAGALRDANIETVECAIHALPDVEKALRIVGARLGKAAEGAHRGNAVYPRSRTDGRRWKGAAVGDRRALLDRCHVQRLADARGSSESTLHTGGALRRAALV